MSIEAGEQKDPSKQEAPPSIISKSLRINGDLYSAGQVHIDGTIKGNLQAASVVVGEKGSIEGNIAADTVAVHGFVSGNVTARNVEFRATAHVIGDTAHEELRVEKGACLDGNIQKRATTRKTQTKASI